MQVIELVDCRYKLAGIGVRAKRADVEFVNEQIIHCRWNEIVTRPIESRRIVNDVVRAGGGTGISDEPRPRIMLPDTAAAVIDVVLILLSRGGGGDVR